MSVQFDCCHCHLQALQVFSCRQIQRSFSSNTEGEIRITKILKEKFPRASSLKVVDISGKHLLNNVYNVSYLIINLYVCAQVYRFVSGGCGAMYEIHIESDEFRGKRIVQQHQIVNQVCPKYRSEEGIVIKSGAQNVFQHVAVLLHEERNEFFSRTLFCFIRIE